MHVESQNATSGAIRVVITSNNGRSIANIYMNITGVYQEDSVFVRKGMKAYILANTANDSNVRVSYNALI